MLHVAIVEDNDRDAEQLSTYLQRFSKQNSVEINVERFTNGLLFLQSYKGNFDIIFMDIDMPMMGGMDTARTLRKIDPHVLLIFVTALARFALNGYEVDAYDFIVKPLQENFFSAKMHRAMKKLSSEQRVRLLIKSGEKTVRVFADEIMYVDIFNHQLTFHTEQGDFSTRGTMKDVMDNLNTGHFSLCNKSILVNLNHVEMVDGDEVVMASGVRLPISRPRKTEFMQQIADFYGNKKINLGRF